MRWVCVFLFVATGAMSLEPGEMLTDPALEARAQALDDLIRCVKCRSESIASSNASWASDARNLLREMIAEGATDQEVLDRFVAAYGDVVLMRPAKSGTNWILWLAGPVLFLMGLIIAWRASRVSQQLPESLNDEEVNEVQAILDKLT